MSLCIPELRIYIHEGHFVDLMIRMRTQADKRRQHDAALHATHPKPKYSSPVPKVSAPGTVVLLSSHQRYLADAESGDQTTCVVRSDQQVGGGGRSRGDERMSGRAVHRTELTPLRRSERRGGVGRCEAPQAVGAATHPDRSSINHWTCIQSDCDIEMTTRHGVVSARRAAASPHVTGGRRSTRGAARRRDSHGGLGGEDRRDCRPGAHGLCR